MADNRFLNVILPSLPSAKLKLAALSGREGISQLFEFQLDLVSEFSGISAEKLIGQNIVCELVMNGYKRFINGYISRFAQLDSTFRFTRYTATVVPWLYFLTKKSNCKIYQDKKIADIVREVVNGQPRPPSVGSSYNTLIESPVQGFEPRSYLVQYRETDFNFISRLMEEEGIFYYFRHALDRHELVITDSMSGLPDCPEISTIAFHPTHHAGVDDDVVTSFRYGREFHSGQFVMTAYDYQQYKKNFQVDAPTLLSVGNNSPYELYDHCADYSKGRVGQPPGKDESDVSKVKNEGDMMVKVRMEEEELRHKAGAASSTCATVTSGHKFTLKDFPSHTFSGQTEEDFNREYVITYVQHSAFDSSLVSGEDAPITYNNHFWCIPSDVQYRPPRIAPKPVIHGLQTAVVTGPPGEEIYTDKYGRVKVQFYWDRDQKFNENSSCWIRVSHPWAGKNWGGVWLPRVGHEVIVSFLEGDPDQPMIVGRVYNADNMHPYELPSNQTQSGFKSRSSACGGSANFNEIRFEDKMGQEEVYVHAEKNLTTMVENDEQRDVGGNRTTNIKKDDTLHVYMNSKTNIDMEEEVTIGMNAERTVAINQKETYGAKLEIMAGGQIKMTTPSMEIMAANLNITSGNIAITAGAISVTCPITTFAGVVNCMNLIANVGVVSPLYSPGIGNLI